MSKYKVFWTTQASNDLEENYNYICDDSPTAAKMFFAKIKQKSAKLHSNPDKDRVVSELKELGINHYREIIISPYRIIFKVENFSIYLFAIVDGRRDLESFLFNRLMRF